MKGAFGTLRRENALYELQRQENPNQSDPWSGSTVSLQLPPIATSPYQQALDQGVEPPQLTTETVRFWSDYNHLFFHPRSVVQLNEYELNSSLMPFEKWQTGEDLFANLDREHDLLDRDLRPFLEECDQLQGLQILSGTDDAWGGFTARYLERISDELGKGCRWVFGLNNGRQTSRERQPLQTANFAQSLYALDSTASVHVPITSVPASLPAYVLQDSASPWHTSALEAVAIESITLPTRLRPSELSRATFDQLEAVLNNEGHRRLIAAAMSLEDPAQLQRQLDENGMRDTRMTNGITGDSAEEDMRLDIDFFPGIRGNNHSNVISRNRRHTFTNMEALRGPWRSATELESSDPRSGTETYQSQLLFPLLSSYPRVFRFAEQPDSLAVDAVLSTSTMVADRLRELEGTARRLIGIEDREAISDGLATMAEEYVEGWSGSERSDDED